MIKSDDITKYQAWVVEAQWAQREFRAESWRDCEMYDGGPAQWTQEDWDKAVDAGIDPITINRTFPVVNLLLGSQAINKFDVIAKARTQEDSEISQVMSEAIAFVMDQSYGDFVIAQAFNNQIVPGFGFVSPSLESDPRKERVCLKYRDWKQCWWDPFGPPWIAPETTRYFFMQRWMDLDNLVGLFPEKAKEIREHYDEIAGERDETNALFMDEDYQIEEAIRQRSGTGWVDSKRQRIRPVEMWHPEWEFAVFAKFADGRVIEITDDMPLMAQYEIMTAAQEIVKAPIQKMYVTSFFGDLKLLDMKSPFPHDQYPFIPFIGYIDRLHQPYGVPRQIRGQDEEVNKRRSMALELLRKRRIIVERSAFGDDDNKMQKAYEEMQKIDGFVVLEADGIGRIKIDEHTDLSPAQVSIGQDSEREISQISGANFESLGYETNADSGKAIEKRITQGSTVNAPLFENLRRSLTLMGEQLVANVQGNWTGEKILRITDRLTGAEKFVEINKRIQTQQGVITLKNNITQGKYDIVVSEAPETDTVREQNMNLIIEWVKKSPPEMIPHLMVMALEMSNIPNKEAALAKLKPLLGADPLEEDMTEDERKAKMVQEAQARDAQAQKEQQLTEQAAMLELQSKELENQKTAFENKKIQAQILEILQEIREKPAKLQMEAEKHTTSQFQEGMNIGERMMGNGDNGVRGTERSRTNQG